ncbi:MAG: tRNA (guanosine(46)-N7)-methyltransferase TrmB [bacterium]|nr:MAG: tRNA (guanosine(46)-N7)-methyltransferase TrmB [bacterium]
MKSVRILQYSFDPHSSGEFPLNLAELFPKGHALAVEVGCGNGEFLVEWAKTKKEWNFVGVELSIASAERFLTRVFQHELHNVIFVRDDARFILRELFPDESVKQVMLNFPDPWPKEKHKSRRIIDPRFVQTLSAVLEYDGLFDLFTDQQWYAQDAEHLFKASGAFAVSNIQQDPERITSTKYERKWKEQFRQIYHLQAIKKKRLQIKRILEESIMPHFIGKKQLKPALIRGLKGLEKIDKTRVFKVKEIFEKQDEQTFLLRTVAVDEDYLQTFFILVASHEQGFIVKLDQGFQPYRTPAVKWAVEVIGKMLIEK